MLPTSSGKTPLTASTVLRSVRETARVWHELEQIVGRLGLPERVIFALSDTTFGFRIRNATYRTAADTNEATASRDLKLLVDSGLLVAEGEKRGRVYAASQLLREVRDRNREPEPLYKPALPAD